MSRPYRTPEDRSRRRKATIVIVVVVLTLIGWITAVGALTGGSERGGGEQAAAPKATGEETTGEKTTEKETAPEGEQAPSVPSSGNQDSGEDKQQSPPTHPDVPSEPSPGDWQQGEAPEGEPVVQSGSEKEHSSSPSGTGGGSQDDSESDDSEGDGEEDEAAEQGGFDPLGKDPQPGDLTETDEDKAEAAADRYVTAAYGYTGNSEKDYRQGVEQVALASGLYRSPGGERIEEYAEVAGGSGITSAAVMDSFEITSSEPSQVKGTAYFQVGKSYNRYAELKGEKTSFEQEMTLCPVYSTYRVCSAEAEEEVTKDNGREGDGS